MIGVPGRVMSVRVKCSMTDECLNFVVVYGKAAGVDGGAWLDGLVDVMDQTYTTVVLGDFNFVEDEKDREGGAVMLEYDRTLARKFGDKMGGWDLQDVFRAVRGDDDDFTYCHHHGARSRIDRVYTEPELVGRVTKVTSKPFLGQVKGHRMVRIEIEEGLELGRGYWKFNVSLLKDSAYVELIS